jgi:hypothetical protein
MRWGDDQQFLKESVTLIRACKMPYCENFAYKPKQDDWKTKLGLCAMHRRQYYRNFYMHFFTPWFQKQTPEKQKEMRAMNVVNWNKWVTKNIDRRREISLKSYHKNAKAINKKRRRLYRLKKEQALKNLQTRPQE